MSRSKTDRLTTKLLESESRLAEYEALWGDGDSVEIAMNVERKLRYYQGEVEALRVAVDIMSVSPKKAKGPSSS